MGNWENRIDLPKTKGLERFALVEVVVSTVDGDAGTFIQAELVVNRRVVAAGFKQWWGRIPDDIPQPPGAHTPEADTARSMDSSSTAMERSAGKSDAG